MLPLLLERIGRNWNVGRRSARIKGRVVITTYAVVVVATTGVVSMILHHEGHGSDRGAATRDVGEGRRPIKAVRRHLRQTVVRARVGHSGGTLVVTVRLRKALLLLLRRRRLMVRLLVASRILDWSMALLLRRPLHTARMRRRRTVAAPVIAAVGVHCVVAVAVVVASGATVITAVRRALRRHRKGRAARRVHIRWLLLLMIGRRRPVRVAVLLPMSAHGQHTSKR